LELRVEDDARQAHSAAGRPEDIRVFCARALINLPVGSEEPQKLHVMGKRTLAMVVFAVDIGRDGAAEGDVFCAGCDGQKPTCRDDHIENLGKTHA
jgi:hypothetical protein